MMNVKKLMKAALVLCLAAMLLMLGGCKKADVVPELLGVWELTDMTGTEEAEMSMQYYEMSGVKVQMAISRTNIEMVTTFGAAETYDHQTTTYRIEGDKFITEASESVFTLKDDTLTLTNEGVTMVYTRK